MRIFAVILSIFQVLVWIVVCSDAENEGSMPLSRDNSCGAAAGTMCDLDDPLGGPCCSASGWCGRSDAYCGEGCQRTYSTPGSCLANMNNLQADGEGQNPNSSSQTSTSARHRHYTHPAQHTLNPEPQPSMSPGRSPQARQEGDKWIVEGSGSFSNYEHFKFSGDNLPDGLYASTYPVEEPSVPFNHAFDAANVFVRDGFLQLRVPGGQSTSPVECAEVVTTTSDILHASVRTFATFSNVPGTCHGMFFYKSDTQEIDIEYLSDPKSLSNPQEGRYLHFTNQATTGVRSDNSHGTARAPVDVDSNLHEYRIDWTANKVAFFVDGDLKQIITSNIPTTPGSWIWNNWANGDPGWTCDLPKNDNVFKISEIVMYFNRAA